MHIACPHCGTAYDIAPAALGPDGRKVRCVRCRETWHAQIDEMEHADALVQAAEEIGRERPAPRAVTTTANSESENIEDAVPRVESPPIANDHASASVDWSERIHDAAPVPPRPGQARRGSMRRFAFGSGPSKGLGFSPPMAIAAMAALVLALIVWRVDVVRLLPQTAAFFQFTGLGVNLRGLAFEDVRVSTEMVSGNRVFVIEGAIAPASRKPVEIPRLRFVVQDAQGAEIYAWNSVVDQAVINPGERVAFRSRLASPPPEAQTLVVRFFNRRDLMSGNA